MRSGSLPVSATRVWSAPSLAGKGLANPLAAILSGGLMLNYLGQPAAAAAAAVEGAVARALEYGAIRLSPDGAVAGGTVAVAEAVLAELTSG